MKNILSLNINDDLGIYSIGVLADMLNIHPRTLRIYDKEKLLCPKRTNKNRRLYSNNDYIKAKVILFLTRNLAINLAGVKMILELTNEKDLEKIYQIGNKKFSKLEQEKNIKKYLNKGREKQHGIKLL